MKTLPSDTLLAITLRAIGDGVILCDREGRIVVMNRVAEALTGWMEAEASGHVLKEVFQILGERSREPVEDPVDKVLRMGAVVGMVEHTVLVRRDGTEVPIDDSAAPVFAPGGDMRGVVLVFRDVSEQRAAEWSLELLAGSGRILSEARDVSLILQGIGRLASRHFADFVIFDLQTPSRELQRVIGPHRSASLQWVADGAAPFLPHSRSSVHPTHDALFTGESVLLNNITVETMEAAAINAEHLAYYREHLRPRSVLAVPITAGDVNLGVMTFVRHTTPSPFTSADKSVGEELAHRLALALKSARLEEDLRMERARLNAVVENVPVGILVAETSGKVLLTNKEAETIFRHPAIPTENVDGHGEWVSYHADGRQVRGEEYPLPRAMAEDKSIRGEEYLYQRGDGTTAWVSLSAAPMRDESGTVIGGVVAVADIDAEKRTRESLRRSQERFELLIERASVGINIGNAAGALAYLNPALLSLIGYTRDEVERGEVRWDQLTPPQYAERDRQALEQLRETGRATPYEKAYRAKDGRLVPILIGATLIPSLNPEDGEDDIAVFFTDLSLQKRAETALLQTEKLAAVGKLASSISHEINNPLEAVMNLLFIVKQDETLSQSTRDFLDSADRELLRVSQVVSQTLRFHRQSTSAMTVHPEALLEEVLSLYSSRVTNFAIKVMRAYERDVSIICYEGDIRQVLNNLVGNAIDSMRLGGRLTVRTRYAKRWSSGQEGMRITVADTGEGMTAAVRARVFEAFYTTKGIHGTGLGLWISHRIVHKHRGRLQVRSSVGLHHGTVFTLWLPLRLAETAREPWHFEGVATI